MRTPLSGQTLGGDYDAQTLDSCQIFRSGSRCRGQNLAGAGVPWGGGVDVAFDVDALRKKYAYERDRRLRSDGIAQYVEIAGPFARFADDPWSDPDFTRDPLSDEVDVAIVGAGFGGLLTGARLRQFGVQSIRLIDKAADVGGTWYWNRYPGIACDVESYVYMPLLEELGCVPTEKYAKGDEIFAHCRRIAGHYDLYRDACLQTEVNEIRWDSAVSRWIISTNHGDAIRARFVAMANGYLQKPKLPGIEGITEFEGHAFHTSRWDYEYTGPDLARLSDKRVGIIGTGATAIQCVPHLARSVKHLMVFQRTPSTVDVRANRPTDPSWSADLEEGWQRRRIENFQLLTAGGEADEDLVNDAWTSIVKKLFVMRQTSIAGMSDEERKRTVDMADFAKMEEIRARVDAIVTDRATAEALKPWYGYFCKRPCFHDEYLQTFNRENVTLVDTQGRGVERITDNGLMVGGTEHTVDCLIFATGFEVGTDYSRRTGFELVGRDGLTLTDNWRDGVRTHHGLNIHGFPNCFVLSIAQSGFTVNFPYLLDIQARHVAWVVAWGLSHAATELEASANAEEAWVEMVVERSTASAERAKSCTPGYYNREGQANEKTRQGSFFFGSPTEYADILEAWREQGLLEGLEIRGEQLIGH
ncbi:MAG: flavin-containing monooxygenase [Mycobacterium sp.]